MVRSVNIEVYCDQSSKEDTKDIFAVASEHRPDLPKPFDKEIQDWAQKCYTDLEVGESIEEAGEMIYEPHNDILEIEKR